MHRRYQTIIQNTVDPAGGDNAYELGQQWINTTTGNIFFLKSIVVGVATWIDVTNASALTVHPSADCGSIGSNVVIANELEVGDTLDAVLLTGTMRVLLKDQTDPKENGIYTPGTPATRVADLPGAGTFGGDFVFISGGTVNAKTGWAVSGTGTTGTDNMFWYQFSAAGSYTASNVGSAGTGVFYTLAGSDFQFKKINAGSARISISNDPVNHKIDIDVSEAAIVHNNLDAKQGGAAGEYYHLTSAKYGVLTTNALSTTRLLSTDAGGNLASVSNLATWITGTANKITATDNGAGGISLNIPPSSLGGIVALVNQVNDFGAFNQSFDTNVLFVDASNDRIGIKTAAPSVELDVVGQTKITSGTWAPLSIYRTQNATGSVYGAILLERSAFGTPVAGVGAAIHIKAPNDASASKWCGTIQGLLSTVTAGAEVGDLRLNASWQGAEPSTQPHLVIRATDGTYASVGINVAAPLSRLHVVHNSAIDASSTWNNAGGAGLLTCNASGQIHIGVDSSNPYHLYFQGRSSSNTPRNIVLNPVVDETQANSYNKGRVGIGVASGSTVYSMLDVAGTVGWGIVPISVVGTVTIAANTRYSTYVVTSAGGAPGAVLKIPNSSTCPRRILIIKNIDGRTFVLTTTGGTDLFDNATVGTSFTFPAWGGGDFSSIVLQADGTSNWFILSRF